MVRLHLEQLVQYRRDQLFSLISTVLLRLLQRGCQALRLRFLGRLRDKIGTPEPEHHQVPGYLPEMVLSISSKY
jgi:hypothetical protein